MRWRCVGNIVVCLVFHGLTAAVEHAVKSLSDTASACCLEALHYTGGSQHYMPTGGVCKAGSAANTAPCRCQRWRVRAKQQPAPAAASPGRAASPHRLPRDLGPATQCLVLPPPVKCEGTRCQLRRSGAPYLLPKCRCETLGPRAPHSPLGPRTSHMLKCCHGQCPDCCARRTLFLFAHPMQQHTQTSSHQHPQPPGTHCKAKASCMPTVLCGDATQGHQLEPLALACRRKRCRCWPLSLCLGSLHGPVGLRQPSPPSLLPQHMQRLPELLFRKARRGVACFGDAAWRRRRALRGKQ